MKKMTIKEVYDILKVSGMTPALLGRICGVGERQMRRYCLGEATPRDTTLNDINSHFKSFAGELSGIEIVKNHD